MGLTCFGTSAGGNDKTCKKYYSVKGGDYCSDNYDCQSGWCPNNKCSYTNPQTPNGDLFKSCNEASDCVSTTYKDSDGNKNAVLIVSCECGYSSSTKGVCPAFYGDKYAVNYKSLHQEWINIISSSKNVSKCNTTHRDNKLCMDVIGWS
jgi:hypothetical protein